MKIDYRPGIIALLAIVLLTCDTRQWEQAEQIEPPATIQNLRPLEWPEAKGAE